MKELKALAGALDIPVITAMQINDYSRECNAYEMSHGTCISCSGLSKLNLNDKEMR